MLHDALQRRDAEQLARLMLDPVSTGAYATEYFWHAGAAAIAADLLRGVKEQSGTCYIFYRGDEGDARLVLGGFDFPEGTPLPAFRLNDGRDFHQVSFDFEAEPPFRITNVMLIPSWDLREPGTCEEPAARIFGLPDSRP